jgi:hypothetical protein
VLRVTFLGNFAYGISEYLKMKSVAIGSDAKTKDKNALRHLHKFSQRFHTLSGLFVFGC